LIKQGVSGNIEWEILVDRLTVHETRFFRDKQALELISSRYIKPILETETDYQFNIWSVGCATGEEPYSLAMHIDNLLASVNSSAKFSITAVDVSNRSISVGREGVYSRTRLQGVSEEYLQRYFEKLADGQLRVCRSLRERVCFMRMNLLNTAQAPVSQMDIILCQNVLIYFKRERRIEVLNELAEHLKPGGILVLGAGEILGWQHPAMQVFDTNGILSFQRKRDQVVQQ